MKRFLILGVAASSLLLAPASAQTPPTTSPPAATAERAAQPAQPETQQMAPAPAAQTAPTQSCAARSLAIRFDSNSASVSQEGRQVLAQLTGAGSACHIERVVLTGHTDRSGDPNYNLALSRRRSEAVRDVLAASGVPADAIAIEAQGEASATGDAANDRRVEVRASLAAGPAVVATPRS